LVALSRSILEMLHNGRIARWRRVATGRFSFSILSTRAESRAAAALTSAQ
jgi:hypothetical protein